MLAAKEKGFAVNVVYPSDYGIDLYADTLFTTEKMLKEKPDVVKKFVAATLKGWTTAIGAPEEAAQITVKYGDQIDLRPRARDDESERAVAQPDNEAVGSMDAASWSSAQKLLLDRGIPEDTGRHRQGLHHASDAMNAIVLTDRLDAAPICTGPSPRFDRRPQCALRRCRSGREPGLTVRRGEFVSLLGPSGCGKSTLLKAIAGLVLPPAGRSARRDPQPPPHAGRSGYRFMFQKPLLLPWRTTLDNVLLPIEIQIGGGAINSVERQNALRMLDLVGLSDFRRAYPHQFSGGMQQRAALGARADVRSDILLLDEPFGALDELTRDVLNEELIRIWQSKETRLTTVLMVTHSIPEAVTMSDRVIVLIERPARMVEMSRCRARARARRTMATPAAVITPHPTMVRSADDIAGAAAADVRPAPAPRLAGDRVVGRFPEYLLPAPMAIVATIDRIARRYISR